MQEELDMQRNLNKTDNGYFHESKIWLKTDDVGKSVSYGNMNLLSPKGVLANKDQSYINNNN